MGIFLWDVPCKKKIFFKKMLTVSIVQHNLSRPPPPFFSGVQLFFYIDTMDTKFCANTVDETEMAAKTPPVQAPNTPPVTRSQPPKTRWIEIGQGCVQDHNSHLVHFQNNEPTWVAYQVPQRQFCPGDAETGGTGAPAAGSLALIFFPHSLVHVYVFWMLPTLETNHSLLPQ